MMKTFIVSAVCAAALLSVIPAMAEDGKAHPGAERAKAHFEKADADKSGTLSKAEFLARHEEMFAKIDADGNGQLTPDEMKAHREAFMEKRKEMREKRKGAGEAPAEGATE